MKIIFLDMDGVLNNEIDYDESKYKDSLFDLLSENCIKNLNTIIIQTGAKIVLSSTWRYGTSIKNFDASLKKAGCVGDVIAFTPSYSEQWSVRGNEILSWVQLNVKFLNIDYYRSFTSYVILDDDSDMLYWQRNNFIRTNPYYGLTLEDALKAIEILTKGEKSDEL